MSSRGLGLLELGKCSPLPLKIPTHGQKTNKRTIQSVMVLLKNMEARSFVR